MDRGAWPAIVHRVAESDTTEEAYHACLGGPGGETLLSHCRVHRFDPWSGN